MLSCRVGVFANHRWAVNMVTTQLVIVILFYMLQLVGGDLNNSLVVNTYPDTENTSRISSLTMMIPIIVTIVVVIFIYYVCPGRTQQLHDVVPPPQQSQDAVPPPQQSQDAVPPPQQSFIDPSTAFYTYVHGSDSIRDSTTDVHCPICLDDFQACDVLCDLPNCHHIFHTDCLREWFSISTRADCPICRYAYVG